MHSAHTKKNLDFNLKFFQLFVSLGDNERRRGMSKRKAVAPKDWRETLFFWHGALEGWIWKGTWVGGESDLPPLDLFENQNTFEAKVLTLEGEGSPPAGECTLDVLLGSYFSVDSSYQLDNGDGHEAYQDLDGEGYTQTLVIQQALAAGSAGSTGLAPVALAAACGENQFGHFSSFGYLSNQAGGGLKLTLARRYLHPGDERAERVGNKEQLKAFLQSAEEAVGGETGVQTDLLAGRWQNILPYRAKGAKKKAKS